MKPQTIFLAALSVLAFQSSWANHVTVSKSWVRTTVPGQAVAGAYMEITTRETARLIAVRSPISPNVEIHWMQMNGDIMRMRAVRTLDLPKNSTVSLKPGSYHLMLMRLKKPINAGDKIPLTLVIETQGKREMISVEAIARGNTMDEVNHNHDHMHH